MRRAVLTFVVALVALARPAAALADDHHTIAAGETLSAIAAHYGVAVPDLAAANGIADVNFVVAGTVLTIPGQSSTYVVQPGDTLAKVARQYGSSVSELAADNQIANPNLVVVGQVLRVPSSPEAGLATPADFAVPPPADRADIEAALEKWSDRNGIDPYLAKGLAWHESGWQQDVVSSTDAVGVMQLMPSAADHISQDLIGVPELDRFVMEDNVRMGVRYLSQLLDDFNGDERLALASYYQGERAVREIGVYTESEQFVANVLANRDLFKASGV